MKFKNRVLEEMLQTVEKYLDRMDLIGYAAARNYRKIETCLKDLHGKRDELLVKYGVKKTDSNNPSRYEYCIGPNDHNYPEFIKLYSQFLDIEHDVDIFKIDYSEAIEKLSGKELLEIDWMFED